MCKHILHKHVDGLYKSENGTARPSRAQSDFGPLSLANVRDFLRHARRVATSRVAELREMKSSIYAHATSSTFKG
jgi:hypothetical protein